MKNSKGFTLIEIMIAMLVLTIGLLGVAGLQNRSLNFNRSAYLDTQATFLANNILEKIRVNRDQSPYVIAIADDAPEVDLDACAVANCTPDAMAQWDVALWRNELNNRLPDGTGSVARIVVGGGETYVITVQYSDEFANGGIRQLTVRSEI